MADVLHGVTTTGKELGRGHYAEVFQVQYCGTKYAAKEFHSFLQELSSEASSTVRKTLDQFFSMCSRWRHPNIVQFIGIYYPEPNKDIPAMVMEQMDCSLTTFIAEQSKTILLHNALSILHDVSLGLRYLHSRNPPIIHCDLTPNNILINTSSMVAKIAGSVATLEYGGDVLLPGSLCFMPPEALNYPVSYDLPLDVFSYGGTALYVVVGRWPKPLSFDPKITKMKALSEVERRQQYLDKIIGEAEVLRPLVEECLNNDPARRPTIEVVSEIIKEMKQNYMDRHPEIKVQYMIMTKMNV